jgi:uncharacterized protein (DUF2062 family)
LRVSVAKLKMKDGFFHRRIALPILELLRQGVTPEKIALSVALGAALGVFPFLGWTTALCAIAALVLRLNLPAIQIVNYFMYPAQLALLIPFFRLGERLFHAPHLPISSPQLQAQIHAGLWRTIGLLWTTTWHAMIVWLLIAPAFVLVIYAILVPMLRRVLRKQIRGFAEASET